MLRPPPAVFQQRRNNWRTFNHNHVCSQRGQNKRIGASLEAKVLLHAETSDEEFLRRHLEELPGLFIVSQVELLEKEVPGMQRFPTGRRTETLGIEVRPADGAKCPRCWTYAVEVARGEPVCRKCQAALG